MRRSWSICCAACAVAAIGAFTFAGKDTDARERGAVTARAGAPVDSIASPTGSGASVPNLAVGPKGELYLSWLEPADSGHALKVSRLTGSSWSTPATVRSGRDFFVNWADFPSVTVLPGNRLAAHWLQRNGKGTYAYGVRIAQSRDNGRTWGTAVTPHRDTMPVEHGFVAMWPQGNGLGAVWLDGRKGAAAASHGDHGGEMMLMSTTIAPDGKLGTETTVDARTCDCCQNSVAMTSTGPIVAYRNRTNDEIRDIYVSRLVNGKWTEGTAVNADNWKINACPVNGPSIKAAGRNVAIAWFNGARDTNRVNVAFSTDGGAKFGAPIRIDGGSPSGRVDLVMLEDGSVLVSWLERTGRDVAAVQARRVTPSGELGPVKSIATSSAARASGVPRMVMSKSDIYFAWTVPGRPSSVRVAKASPAEFR